MISLKQLFKRKSFRRYTMVGIIIFIISTILTTVLLYVGREWLLISIVILNPIIKVVDFAVGFFAKYFMYDRYNMIKED
jgi:hypothetical protein